MVRSWETASFKPRMRLEVEELGMPTSGGVGVEKRENCESEKGTVSTCLVAAGGGRGAVEKSQSSASA